MAVTNPFPKALMAQIPGGSVHVNDYVLAANVAKTVTVPAAGGACIVSVDPPTQTVWARFDGSAAAVPGADITDGTGSFPNPGLFAVRPGQTFSIIADAICTVGVAFYKAPGLGDR